MRHCVVSLSKNINPSLVLVQPRKTRPFIAERLLMGRQESNQTKQTKLFSVGCNTIYGDLNHYKMFVPLFEVAYAASNKGAATVY